MKKRINELLNGIIEDTPVTLEVSETRLTGSVKEQEYYSGKFGVRVKEGKSIQGFLFSSNARMGFRPDVFVGSSETFRFEADTTGLHAGDVLDGEFILNTTIGEYRIPYAITIERNEDDTQEQTAMTPEQFAEMAKHDFGSAYVPFVSRKFQQILKEWGTKYELLYEGLCERNLSYQSLEQFLVGAGLKKECSLSLEQDYKYLRDVEETRKEEIVILKNCWGFEKITISCEEEFIQIERPEITTDEFVGNTCHAGFLICREKLHAGRNFARIRITSGCRELICTIEVRNGQKTNPERSLHRQKQETRQLLSSYIGYRTGKTGLEEWSGISLKSLDNYRRAGGRHIFYDLYEIYILLLKEDTLQAELLFSQIEDRKKELTDPGWKGFYLYLTMLQSGSEEYQEYIGDQMEKLFLENQENWVLQWLMFRTNEKMFRNDTEKLDCIRRQYLCGCASPILYLDAYDILKKEPLMLRKLESFEIHLLSFICREHLQDREISGQTAQLAGRCQDFDPILYRVLVSCFDAFPTKNLLTAICGMLIKGRKNESRYAKWFAMGIKQDVRLTGMYEYFVETAHDLSDRMLPQSVRMYFIYHNTLDYVRKALIYANIIRNRNRDLHTYETYRDAMCRFMEEQLELGRVNRDLALLYEVLISRELMTEPLAAGLQKVLFTYEISCSNPVFRHVVVLHKELQQEQKVMLEDGRACVQIYSSQACVFLEDAQGNRYGAELHCQMKKLLTRTVFEDYCRELLKEPLGILLHDCGKEPEGILVAEETVSDYIKLLTIQSLKPKYREAVRTSILNYFSEHLKDPNLEAFLDRINVRETAREQKKETARLLAYTDRYRDLYELVKVFGPEEIETEILVRMCSFCITDTEAEEDRMLTAVCAWCFTHHLYDEKILGYLLRYFEGPVGEMKDIWYAAQNFGLASFAFEEKILGMLLFEQEMFEHTEPIFAAYMKNLGKSRICRAYAIRMSYEYFVKEKEVEDPVFSYMEQNMAGNTELPEVARLALLKWYTMLENRSAGQQKWMEYLLESTLEKNMYFAFFMKLPEKLKRRYHLRDKLILEYRTGTGKDVILHYRYNQQKEQNIMLADTFDGIYTKVFTMFYRDRLEWYFTAEEDGGKMNTQTRSCVWSDAPSRDGMTRYDLINRLIDAKEKQDPESFEQIMRQYHAQQYLVDQIFQVN